MEIWDFFFTVFFSVLITALVSALIGVSNTNDRLRQEIKKLEKRD